MKFEIVSHCLFYDKLLCCQLSSIHRVAQQFPGHLFTFSIVSSKRDTPTSRVANFFRSLAPSNLEILSVDLLPERVMNRAIGRNIRARETKADLVWFADVDHLIYPSCIETLVSNCGRADMIWPSSMLYMDKVNTQLLLDSLSDICIVDVVSHGHPGVYRDRSRPIGGLQFVLGDYARRNGYSRSRFRSATWNFASDVTFRRKCTNSRSVGYLDILRLRHFNREAKNFNVYNNNQIRML